MCLKVTTSLDNPSLPLGGDTNTVNNTSNTAVDDFTSNSSNVSMRSLYDCSGKIVLSARAALNHRM